jgi:hypothetical protein
VSRAGETRETRAFFLRPETAQPSPFIPLSPQPLTVHTREVAGSIPAAPIEETAARSRFPSEQGPEPRSGIRRFGKLLERRDEVTGDSIEGVRSLLEAPSPAVLATYRKDGSALVSPVWFRWSDGGFEVVIAKGDLKLRHLARDPRCVLVVFEVVRPSAESRCVG